jgi:heavy metal sensor kinase
MPRRDIRRLARGLRFRLTASYALFFALLMIGVTAIYRQLLSSSLTTQAHDVLDQEWAAMKGYLRIERNPETDRREAYWYYDDADPDESRINLNIKRIYLVADELGNLIPDNATGEASVSAGYRQIGVDPPAAIAARVREALHPAATVKNFWAVRRNVAGEEFLIRSGIVFDEGHHLPYYVGIGTSLRHYNLILREFTWLYAGVIPLSVILGALLGWIMAGRALKPVLEVAQAAQRISGSNLSMRIPLRQAGDELDYLILTFNRMIERLEATFRQMRQFSADVSHELRTPITAIRGQLEVALFTANTTEQYREAMFNALQDIDRLSQLVRALLLLSQAESGQVVLQKSRLDLAEVAADLVEQFQIPAEAAGVRLTTNLGRNCAVDADRVQVERMITNLLSNALKFTPEGGAVTVSVRPPAAGAHNGRVELAVEDTGRGIPPEHLPRIFDRFYRITGSGSAPSPEQGIGLGLSFVAWIAHAHHGTVDVESTPGKGTRFTVRLPASGVGIDTVELAAGQPAAHS